MSSRLEQGADSWESVDVWLSPLPAVLGQFLGLGVVRGVQY